MLFRNKNILIISPEPWDHIFVSKHHYAIHLARLGNRVFFVNPPGNSESLAATRYENVFQVDYRRFPRGLRFYPAMLQRRSIGAAYKRIKSICDCEFEIIWSFDNSVFYDFSAIPSDGLKICHIVDLNQNFQTMRSAATADFCLASSELIKERLLAFNKKVYKIHHGFNMVTTRYPVQLPGQSSIKAVYAGNLSMSYIDWEIFRSLVSSHPEVDFVFIGPDNDADGDHHSRKASVLGSANVFQIGRIESDLLPSFLEQADVLLVCYKEEYFKEQANPHKIMEYLGAGPVVVATFAAEFAEQTDLIEMARQNDSIPVVFSQVVKNLERHNRPDLMDRRRLFAADHAYDRQIDRIEKIIVSDTNFFEKID